MNERNVCNGIMNSEGMEGRRLLSGMLASSSPAFDVLNLRLRRVEQFPFGLQPVIQIVTVLASARQKQLVGAFGNRLRDRMTSLRERIASAS
jgi:hypothetical protein